MKRKRRKYLVFLIAFEIIAILALLALLYVHSLMDRIQYDDSADDRVEQNEQINEDLKGYRNVAIFGVDSRSNALGAGSRSDTIMIASINKETKEVKLVSIYRDTYVEIPEYGYNKINAAYAKGGYSLALSTINKSFDLDITEYVTVNFSALIQLVDLMGGIELNITEDELNYINIYVRELNKINGTSVPNLTTAGTQTVNGTYATAYARIRYTAGGDFMRAQRQRIVINQLFEKAKKLDLFTLNQIANEMLPQILTNLDAGEMLMLLKDIFSYSLGEQSGFPFEKAAAYYNEIAYVFPIDVEQNVKELHAFLFGTEDYEVSDYVKQYSDYVKTIYWEE